jgi:hypothetical protein
MSLFSSIFDIFSHSIEQLEMSFKHENPHTASHHIKNKTPSKVIQVLSSHTAQAGVSSII